MSQSARHSQSAVNVLKTRTGSESRSGGIATYISLAPTSIPAALGSTTGRSGWCNPLFFLRPICFFASVSICFLELTFFPFRFQQRPSCECNGHSSNRNQPATKRPTVTTDLGTKLGTRLSNGVAIHHCRDGLLPLLVAIPSSPTRTKCSFLPWPDSAGTRYRGLLKLHTRYGLQSCSPTICGLYREAPPSPVSRLGRSQATKFNQQPP